MKFFRDRWVSAAKYRELVETIGQFELDFAAAQKEFAEVRDENARLKLELKEAKEAQEALEARAEQDAATITQLRLALGDLTGEAH